MAVTEEIIKTERHGSELTQEWKTREELLAKYPNKTEQVQGLIQRCIKEGKVRPHPDWPDDPDMQL